MLQPIRTTPNVQIPVTIAVTFPADELQALTGYCEDTNKKLDVAIRNAVKLYLDLFTQ